MPNFATVALEMSPLLAHTIPMRLASIIVRPDSQVHYLLRTPQILNSFTLVAVNQDQSSMLSELLQQKEFTLRPLKSPSN